MILEGIVTSLDRHDELNVAPMGPIVDETLTALVLRPFRTSRTYQNLTSRPCGVFHVVHFGRLRDFFGFNRGKHAVLEGAILATRVHLIDRQKLVDEFARLRVIVQKTAGPREHEAFALLERQLGLATDGLSTGDQLS